MCNPSVRALSRHNIKRATISAGLAMFAQPSIAEPVRLSNRPSAQWELVKQDGDHHCMLRTRLAGSALLNTIDVDRPLGGRKIEFTLHGIRSGEPPSEFGADYVIGNGKIKSQQVAEYDGDDGRRKVVLEFKDDDAIAISKGAEVSFAIAPDQFITIDTNGLLALLPSADTCNRDHFVELGANPEMVAEVMTEPYAEDSALFTSMDYPAAALRNDEQGTTIALAIVDEEGRVADCRVARSSNSEALDRATCNTLKRRRFEAATNSSGKSIKAPTILRINWVLPRE